MEVSRDFQDKTPLEEMTLKEYVITSKTLSSLCTEEFKVFYNIDSGLPMYGDTEV